MLLVHKIQIYTIKMAILTTQVLLKNRVLIYCAFVWLMQSILIIACVSSNHWITGRISRYGDKPTIAFGLFKLCSLDEHGREGTCATYSSGGWVNFTKALLIMPLLMLWLFVPCAFTLGITESNTAKSHLGIARGNYRMCLYLLGPLLIGSTQAFLKGFPDYTFLYGFSYGWSFYMSIIVTVFTLIQPIIYAVLYKVFPTCLGVTAAEEDEENQTVTSPTTTEGITETTTGIDADNRKAGFEEIEIGIENNTIVNDEQRTKQISMTDADPPPPYEA